MKHPVFLRWALGLALSQPQVANAQLTDLQASYDFLVREREKSGALISIPLVNSSGVLGNYLLPSSFYDSAAYWGVYVCGQSKVTCAVHDSYNSQSYQLLPPPGAAGDLQVERVNAHNGANIYDAATWQIAVMLGAVKSKLRQSAPTSAYALSSTLPQVLRQSGLPNPRNAAPGAKRATTAGQLFVYNGRKITSAANAYSFRAFAPEWLARDPLMGSAFESFITASDLPPTNSDYAVGKLSWSDWKPITGENAWAFLIGPLQAAYIQYVVGEQQPFIPFQDVAIQNALDVLPTFAAMQSPIGAVYYAPAGTIANTGETAINPYQVSVENNLSLYAGLQLLRSTLRTHLKADTELKELEKAKIALALELIEVMIAGGQKTKGLLSFFKNAAWQNGRFVQGGLANDPAQPVTWVPTSTPQAVDVQTWGIAALGAKQIDAWFGDGTAYELWAQLKTWGAYGEGTTLWGVGYSDQDGNGLDANGEYRQGVMSAEWTAGAINAVRSMISYYGALPPTSPRATAAKAHVATLKRDETAMLKALGALRVDAYAASNFPGKPADYAKLITLNTKPYVYASKRITIPFGWTANPIPSTSSTAWVIMLANSYDPFGYAGVPN